MPPPSRDRWDAFLAASADPPRARRHFRLLQETPGVTRLESIACQPVSATALASVLAGSVALTNILVGHPGWLELFQDPGRLLHCRRKEGLARDAEACLSPWVEAEGEGSEARAISDLHALRLRELLRIGARDLSRLAQAEETMLEVSNLADVFLDALLRVVWRRQIRRWGGPWHREEDGYWHPTRFAVIGLGKLGGVELNISSDVDLLLVYTREGETFANSPVEPTKRRPRGGSGLASHEFFRRLAEDFLREASHRGVHAGGLRVDLRLRPEGAAGPLARSLESYETYYAGWGQGWERLMLLKARPVAGDARLGAEFLDLIQPFRYPRSLADGLLPEMAGIKARLEREILAEDELSRNLKLGRGGIREIEFVAQALQVLHGGRNPFLQSPHTATALTALARYKLLPRPAARRLQQAYPFLRDLEHRLQLEDLAQTHTLPRQPEALDRLARQMGLASRRRLGSLLASHTRAVRSVYERILAPAGSDRARRPGRGGHPVHRGTELPAELSDSSPWMEILHAHGFRDPAASFLLLREFLEGPNFHHVSQRTRDLARHLIGRVLDACPRENRKARGFVLSDPDRVLTRLDNYIQVYGARAALYDLWNARPNLFDHVLRLFDRSEHLTSIALASPDLLDGLEAGNHLRRRVGVPEILADLASAGGPGREEDRLRRYFRTELVRVGLRDILDLASAAGTSDSLTCLAEACLQYALERVCRRRRLRSSPLAILGLGKLGGGELDYGTDLDVLFVAANPARVPLERLQGMAKEVMEFLGARSEWGRAFVLDPRLRPDGEKGLLVNTLAAHEQYYRQRARLWEIQSLTRARAIAGDPATGMAFEALARRLTNFRNPDQPLAAYSTAWRAEIARMRRRIERERTPSGLEALAFKTGAGGRMDVEFIAQALSMAHGWFEPNTRRSLEHAAREAALARGATRSLLRDFESLRTVEAVLRRWSCEPESVLPTDPVALHRVAVRCGETDAKALLEKVHQCRSRIRGIYRRVFAEDTAPGPVPADPHLTRRANPASTRLPGPTPGSGPPGAE